MRYCILLFHSHTHYYLNSQSPARQFNSLHPTDFEGVITRRHCTDVLCTILLWIMWLSMTGLGIYAYREGDYRLILYPLDYAGNVCGTDYGLDMTEYPYLYYVNDFAGGVCVKVRARDQSVRSYCCI